MDDKIIKWNRVEGDRSAIEEGVTNDTNVMYEILPNQQRIDRDANGFVVYRISDTYKFEDGILGYFDGEVGVCCGLAIFSAMGLPPNGKCNGDIEYVKKLAERDFHNLMDGKDNVFVKEIKKSCYKTTEGNNNDRV